MLFIKQYLTFGIVFTLTILFGLWVSKAGKPYNGILFNIHKLTALAAVIIVIVRLVSSHKSVEIQASIVLLLILAGMCVLALFISGAIMSIGSSSQPILLIIHKSAIILAIITVILLTYLLTAGIGSKPG